MSRPGILHLQSHTLQLSLRPEGSELGVSKESRAVVLFLETVEVVDYDPDEEVECEEGAYDDE